MNSNGAAHPLKRILDDKWEVVEAHGSKWIGRVDGVDGDIATLSPAFVYISNPQVQPQQNGQVAIGANIRLVLPLEMMASPARVRVRWSVRYRIVDFETGDQAVFESAIAEAMANQRKLAAARAGIAIVPQMPAKLPPAPGGRS